MTELMRPPVKASAACSAASSKCPLEINITIVGR